MRTPLLALALFLSSVLSEKGIARQKPLELTPQEFRHSWISANPDLEVPEHFPNAWVEASRKQDSLYSAEELIQVFLFLRSELATDYSIEYRYLNNLVGVNEARRYARSRGKMLFAYQPVNGNRATVLSFDGKILRSCSKVGSHASAILTDRLDFGALVDVKGDIVIRSMLVNFVELFHNQYALQDIDAFFSEYRDSIWIGSRLMEMDGRMCLSISPSVPL